MVSAGEDAVEDAMNFLCDRKEWQPEKNLKKDILKAVSSLRKQFAKLRSEVEDKNKLIVDLEMKAAETNTTLKALRCGMGSNSRGDQEATTLGLQVNSKDNDWNVALSAGRMRMRYSDIMADRRQGNVPYDNKMYKLFVKSKNNQSAEYTRILLKSKVNLTQMKAGTLKNGQLLIEPEKKSELEEVCKKINDVGKNLKVTCQRSKTPE
jgi:hypothetical protein